MKLPQPFIENITRVWGNQGAQWLKELPDLIKFFSIQWQLNDIKPFDNLSFNYVARAYSAYHNMPVVLKIGVSSPEFLNEAKALEYYGGNGCVRLLKFDQQKSAMILELIQPGTTLRSWFPAHDDKAVEAACQVMKKLHSRPMIDPSDFQTIDQWFALFEILEVPEDLKKHVAKARLLADELKQTAQVHYLLHGDLHHDNILLDSKGNGIAIDPKGVVGEQAYEVGAFMCNPAELSAQADLEAIIFREDVRLETSRVINGYPHRKTNGTENGLDEGAQYLLKEFAFFLAIDLILQTKNITLIYHKRWPVFERFFSGYYNGIQRNLGLLLVCAD